MPRAGGQKTCSSECRYIRKVDKERIRHRQLTQREDYKSWYRIKRDERKQLIVSMLGGACYHCGVKDDPIVYDLHHRNPEDKEYNIGGILAWSPNKIQAEVAKCDLLCANCHRKLHHNLRG